jgi:tetratricopeptide (TPR) repeat protein
VAYYNRGVAHAAKGQYDQTIFDCSKAVEINPRFAEAFLGRAAANYFKKKYDRSWEDIKRAEALGYKIPPNFLEELRKASGREK